MMMQLVNSANKNSKKKQKHINVSFFTNSRNVYVQLNICRNLFYGQMPQTYSMVI